MESEKVEEIKKALEDNANYEHYNKLGYIDGYKCKTVSYADILTYINELESENDTLHTNLYEWRKENQQLKDRIAELEKEIEENAFYSKGYAQGIKNTYEVVVPDKLKQFGKKFELNIGKYLKKKYTDYQQDSFHYIVDKADVDMCLDETLKEYEK